MDRPQAGGYNIYEIALSLRQTDVVSVTRVFQTVARNE